MTVPKGERATGAMAIAVLKIREEFQKELPRQREPLCSVFVQLNHKPWDRGEGDSLDAWTGDVHSKVLPLKLKRHNHPVNELSLLQKR